jgi:hypothetical protein
VSRYTKGYRQRCAACGELGHRAIRGMCSPSHRAVTWWLEQGGVSLQKDAARRFGISPESFSYALKMRTLRARAERLAAAS